jgi:hypothetical protein
MNNQQRAKTVKYVLQFTFPSGTIVWFRDLHGTFSLTANIQAASNWNSKFEADRFLFELKRINGDSDMICRLQTVAWENNGT